MKNKGICIALLLALIVIALGAYTRLTDSGLGCPDWPTCYGRLVLPSDTHALEQAQAHYPAQPIQAKKAWIEMIHRYLAGGLGLLILLMALSSVRQGYSFKQRALRWGLVALVCAQALLGMWTVTLKLMPIIVLLHLLGGFTLLALLWYLRLVTQNNPPIASESNACLTPWMVLGLFLLMGQIALGGWVSAHYAGLACVGFPMCNGQWWPPMDFHQAFTLTPLGLNYEGGLLTSAGRVAIQMLHRIGAVVVAGYFTTLAIVLLRQKNKHLRKSVYTLLILLGVQITLGIINVTQWLPLYNAVAHNVVAALLLLLWVHLLYNVASMTKGCSK